jgi:multidrug efflux pump subunit AcrA (membrane-fusion protein)
MVRLLSGLALFFLAVALMVLPSSATDQASAVAAQPPAPQEPAPEDDEADDTEEPSEDESDKDEAKETDADKDSAKSDAEEDGEAKKEAKSDEDDAKSGEEAKSAKPKEVDADSKEAEKEKEDAKPAAKEEEKKPETHAVETKDLKIEVELDGVFVAEEMEEVALRPKVWGTFKVEEAVAHGERVRKGDVLVKFDDEDIEQAINEKSLDERLGELALMEAEEDFPRHEKSTDLEYQLAKRAYEQDIDEYDRFQKVMRELSEKMANYYLKSAQQELDNAREELEQLQQMYEADELTEETEEIVLKRQKFQVEMAEFYLEYSKINHDYTLNVSIPRREELLSMSVEQSKIAFDRAKMTKSLGLSRERYELERLRETRARAVEKHAELVADRALMTLRAPADGIAYFGRQINGRWIEVGSMESKLVPFGSVTPNSIVYTIVKDRPIYVETSVGEKDFPTLKDGQAAIVTPVSDTEVKLEGSVKSIIDVPGSGNKFAVRLNLKDEDAAPEWLKPGMSCKAKITTYEVEDAVVIPADLVQTDKEDEDKKYVMLQVEDEDKPVRRELKLGKTKGKEVEVLKGLKADDRIVKGAKDEPEEEKEKE